MQKVQDNSYFETAPIGRLLAKFAIPGIISLVVNALYNIVDQIFIGQGVGYLGNGATTVVFPLTMIAISIALLLGDGGAAYLSLKLGEGSKPQARRGVGNSIVLLAGASIVLLVIFLVFMTPLLKLFGATENILPYAQDYGLIIIIGLPFRVCSTGFNSLIRADGNPRLSMISMLVGAVINTILDPVFIFACHWGVKGAALATILGQIASFIISTLYLRKLKSVRLDKRCMILSTRILRSSLTLGLSSFITQISIVIVAALMNNLMKIYGAQSPYGPDIPMTVFGIVMKIDQILIAILIGLATGAQPILGYNYGAGNIKRVRKIYGVMVTISLVISAIGLFVFEVFPQPIINIFGSESALYNQYAVMAFRIFLMMCIPVGYQISSSIFLQAIGKPLPSMTSALLRQLIIFIPAALILPRFTGVEGLLWAGPISDLTSALITLCMIIYTMKKMKEYKRNHE